MKGKIRGCFNYSYQLQTYPCLLNGQSNGFKFEQLGDSEIVIVKLEFLLPFSFCAIVL